MSDWQRFEAWRDRNWSWLRWIAGAIIIGGIVLTGAVEKFV